MKNTRFTARIRIDPKQLDWLRKNKGKYKTLAGKLDEMINFYRSANIKLLRGIDDEDL
jgi:hypothetical protein